MDIIESFYLKRGRCVTVAVFAGMILETQLSNLHPEEKLEIKN